MHQCPFSGPGSHISLCAPVRWVSSSLGQFLTLLSFSLLGYFCRVQVKSSVEYPSVWVYLVLSFSSSAHGDSLLVTSPTEVTCSSHYSVSGPCDIKKMHHYNISLDRLGEGCLPGVSTVKSFAFPYFVHWMRVNNSFESGPYSKGSRKDCVLAFGGAFQVT